jgi:hypothetical protein
MLPLAGPLRLTILEREVRPGAGYADAVQTQTITFPLVAPRARFERAA